MDANQQIASLEYPYVLMQGFDLRMSDTPRTGYRMVAQAERDWQQLF